MAGAEVHSIESLADLRAALLRFGADAEAALRAMDAQIHQTLEHLAKRQQHWESKVREAQQEYERAQAALRQCQSRQRGDSKTGKTHSPPCLKEEEWVLRARLDLAKAEASLKDVKGWQRLVEQAAEQYRGQAQRMGSWIATDLPGACELLASKMDTLYAYTSAGAGRTSTASFAPATTPSSGVPASHSGTTAAFTTTPPAEAAAKTSALGILLAGAGIAACAPVVIGWLSQGLRKFLGDVGEQLAADLVQREGNLREIPFDQSKHGFDRVFLTSDGRVVILESKVHQRGEFHPGQTRAGEQGSPKWIAATADKMANPESAQWSPDNARIAALIREIGSENVPVVGVVIETATGSAHIYHRQGNGDWSLLQGDVSLAEVLSTDVGSHVARSGSLERERGLERETGGGAERLG